MFTRLAVSVLVLLALPAAASAQTAAGPPGDFGDVYVGARSPVVYLPLTATGGDVAIASLATSGANAADFTIPAGSTTCPPTLTSGTTCFVGVQFTPPATGPRTAAVAVNGTDAIALTGTGLTPPGTGAPGDDGAPGAPGPAGPGGSQGPSGPQGIPGRAIQATCTTKGKPPKTSCRIVILPDDVAATSLRVRLVRAGKTVARGSARREGTVRLKTLRRVRAGRYTVAVSFAVDGRRVSGRQVVRVR